MGFFDDRDAKGAVDRLTEEAFYAQALREIESGTRRDGIWAMAMAECEMDQSKAAARYIRLRVQAMKDELVVQESLSKLEAEREAQRKLEEQQRKLEEEQRKLYEDAPRHERCGGVIVRTEHGNFVTWICWKCKATGRFSYG